jgi:hypothetical protein
VSSGLLTSPLWGTRYWPSSENARNPEPERSRAAIRIERGGFAGFEHRAAARAARCGRFTASAAPGTPRSTCVNGSLSCTSKLRASMSLTGERWTGSNVSSAGCMTKQRAVSSSRTSRSSVFAYTAPNLRNGRLEGGDARADAQYRGPYLLYEVISLRGTNHPKFPSRNESSRVPS